MNTSTLTLFCIAVVVIMCINLGTVYREENRSIENMTRMFTEVKENLTTTFNFNKNTTLEMTFAEKVGVHSINIGGKLGEFLAITLVEASQLGFETGYSHVSKEAGERIFDKTYWLVILVFVLASIMPIIYLCALLFLVYQVIAIGIKKLLKLRKKNED